MLTSDDGTIRRHVLVRGRVQGVGYRAFVARIAERVGVAGMVRNTPDGDVECYLEGRRDTVDEVIGKLRQGPAMARVMDLDVADAEVQGEQGFRIAR